MHKMANELTIDDRLSRFILSDGHFARAGARVKWRAFEPAREDKKVSAFATSGLIEADVWQLGDTYVAPIRGRPILARGDVTVGEVREAGLDAESAEPPPHHADIIEWPDEKIEWMSRAQHLAAVAKLVVRAA